MGTLQITVGDLHCSARWEPAAPRTIEAIRRMLPIESKLIHCRWTGESTWIPFGDFRPGLDYENHTSHPGARPAGDLPGRHQRVRDLLSVRRLHHGVEGRASWRRTTSRRVDPDDGWQDLLREIGRRCLWEGAQEIRIVEVDGLRRDAAAGRRRAT